MPLYKIVTHIKRAIKIIFYFAISVGTMGTSTEPG